MERREGMRRAEARGQFADKGFHGGVPQAIEAKEIHFFDGLIGSPFIGGDAISGDENAGAIVAKTAVHKNFLARIIAEQREKLDKLFVGRSRPATDGDLYKAHTQGFGTLALPVEFFAVFAAEVNDGGDAENFQFGEADFPRLRAAIENLGNFTAVRNAINVQFLAKNGLSEGWRGRLRNRLR